MGNAITVAENRMRAILAMTNTNKPTCTKSNQVGGTIREAKKKR